MSVRLKFRVTKKGEFLTGQYVEGKHSTVRCGSVEMMPVSDGSEENKAFYQATPTGRIEFGSVNAAAVDSLPLGGECYVIIEPISAPDQSTQS